MTVSRRAAAIVVVWMLSGTGRDGPCRRTIHGQVTMPPWLRRGSALGPDPLSAAGPLALRDGGGLLTQRGPRLLGCRHGASRRSAFPLSLVTASGNRRQTPGQAKQGGRECFADSAQPHPQAFQCRTSLIFS
jgi:hypothetical protein